jgi:hypothetical protein
MVSVVFFIIPTYFPSQHFAFSLDVSPLLPDCPPPNAMHPIYSATTSSNKRCCSRNINCIYRATPLSFTLPGHAKSFQHVHECLAPTVAFASQSTHVGASPKIQNMQRHLVPRRPFSHADFASETETHIQTSTPQNSATTNYH